MNKAYDVKVLGEKLKGKGLNLAEESAKIVFETVIEWVEESATISPNIYDDMIKLVLPQIKKSVLAQIDKIDGQVG